MMTLVRGQLAFAVIALFGCGGDSGPDGGTDPGKIPGVEDNSPLHGYYLSSTYRKLVLEVDYVVGKEPNSGAQAQVLSQLGQVLHKPDGITVSMDEEISPRGDDYSWTGDELFELADNTFNLSTDDDTTKIHVLFLDGHSERDTSNSTILGLAWSNTHLVLFKDSIERLCAGTLTPPSIREQLCESAEFSIWLHELGHVIGLVNAGLPMVEPHQDEEHPAHDNNNDCVMYWAYEGDALVTQLRDRILAGNNTPLAFDDNCLTDMAAARGD